MLKPNKDFFRDKFNPYFKSIEKSCLKIIKLPRKKRPFNPFAFVNQKLSQKIHIGAVDQSLSQLINYYDSIQNPWAYLNTILKTTNGNWHEKDHIKEHQKRIEQEFKSYIESSHEIKNLLSGIGKNINVWRE